MFVFIVLVLTDTNSQNAGNSIDLVEGAVPTSSLDSNVEHENVSNQVDDISTNEPDELWDPEYFFYASDSDEVSHDSSADGQDSDGSDNSQNANIGDSLKIDTSMRSVDSGASVELDKDVSTAQSAPLSPHESDSNLVSSEKCGNEEPIHQGILISLVIV